MAYGDRFEEPTAVEVRQIGLDAQRDDRWREALIERSRWADADIQPRMGALADTRFLADLSSRSTYSCSPGDHALQSQWASLEHLQRHECLALHSFHDNDRGCDTAVVIQPHTCP